MNTSRRKNSFFLIIFLLHQLFSFAQWSTNGSHIYNSNSGNVGIGTNLPAVKLHMVGTLSIPTEFRVSGANNPAGWFSYFGSNVSNPDFTSKWNLAELNVTGLSNGFTIAAEQFNGVPRYSIGTKDNTPIAFFANGSEIARFKADGSLGIGKSDPQYKLDVAGDTKVSGQMILEVDHPQGFLRLKPASGTKASRVVDFFEDPIPANSAYGVIGMANQAWAAPVPSFCIISSKNSPGGPTKDIMMWAHDAPDANNSAMIIKANTGNIGIGTANPQGKLAVNGDIVAKKIKVTQSGWPDYVFKPTYRLLTLREVESFIKSNGHLPDIIAAEQVEKEGLNLGDNQAALLKKIEELTLYLIEQEKKLDERKNEIDKLNRLTATLEQRLSLLEKQKD